MGVRTCEETVRPKAARARGARAAEHTNPGNAFNSKSLQNCSKAA
jgi:hypothetical protein